MQNRKAMINGRLTTITVAEEREVEEAVEMGRWFYYGNQIVQLLCYNCVNQFRLMHVYKDSINGFYRYMDVGPAPGQEDR